VDWIIKLYLLMHTMYKLVKFFLSIACHFVVDTDCTYTFTLPVTCQSLRAHNGH